MKTIQLAIADDHLLFRKGISRILQLNSDFEVVLEASNGQELIDNLPKQPIDLVLMDLQMPVMDGIKATEYLKKYHPTIKIIVLSMHDEDNFVTHLMELGANGYLLKDSDPEEVEKAIRTVIAEDYYYGSFLTKALHRKVLHQPAVAKRDTIFASTMLNQLSERELEVLRGICDGNTNSEIADKLFISVRTVDGHRTRVMEKTGTKNTAGLVVYAIKYQLY